LGHVQGTVDPGAATGSCQVRFARLVLAWTMTAARVDSSRQRHQASENSGQTPAAATAGIIAVKAHSSSFASQASRREMAADLHVPCLLLSLVVPQVPPSCGPDAAHGTRPLTHSAYRFPGESEAQERPGDSGPLEAALGYAACGIPVYPVHWPRLGAGGAGLACSCQRGPACDRPAKHPLVRHGVNDATTNPAQLERWWRR
jgi:Bifunctional DNA primase/polymerase, N-terminal